MDALAGENIAFQSLGGAGPRALLLHGFGSDHFTWLANQTALGGLATLFALDLPGHGASGMNVGDGAPQTLAHRIAALIDDRRLGRLHLIGHSLGGGLALLLTEMRPDLVASLTLIAPAGLGAGPDVDFVRALPELDDALEAETLLQRLVVRKRLIGKPLVALVLKQLQKPGAREALRAIGAGMIANAGVFRQAAARVAQASPPRIVVWGEADAINPPSSAAIEAFGGETLFIQGAGHMPHVEEPRAVNAALADFLARAGATA